MTPAEDEKINFHSEDIEFTLPNHSVIFDWINNTVERETKVLRHLNYIFCSDTYLHKINVKPEPFKEPGSGVGFRTRKETNMSAL